MKKLNHVIDDQVVKNTKFNKIKTKVNKLDEKMLDTTTLTHINQYNGDKQNFQKKTGDADKKIRNISTLETNTTVLSTKFKEVDNKIPDASGLVNKKQITTLKQPKSTENTLLLLIIITLRVTYLMQR